jgi:hypothetical protein
MHSRFWKSVENWSFDFESKITKIQSSDAIFNFGAILSKPKLPSTKMIIINRFASKNKISQKAARWRELNFCSEKINPTPS